MIRSVGIVFLLVFLFSSPFAAKAASSPGTVSAKQASVRAEPNAKSEVLADLERGKKVTVLAEKGEWLQVRVALDASFTFEGWMLRKHVDWRAPSVAAKPAKKPPTPKPTATAAPLPPPVVAAPKPVPTQAPTQAPTPRTELDRFFEPAPAVKPQEPKSQRQATPTPLPVTEIESTPQRRESQGSGFFASLTDRASISLGLGYLLYHYKLDTAGATPGEVFAYNLPGFGIDLDIDYWFWNATDGQFRAGTELSYQRGFYKHTTNLQDSSGATFGDVSSSHSSDDIVALFKVGYRFSPVARAAAGELGLGVEYFNFSGNDVSADAGPLSLYVSQQTISVLARLGGQIPLPVGKDLSLGVGVDVQFLNFISEDPSDVTGTSPSGSIGFAPELMAIWAPSEQHRISTGYRLRYQKFDFSGTGSRVGTSNVTDGKVENAVHLLSLRYEYLF